MIKLLLKMVNLLNIDGYCYERPLSGGQMASAAVYKNNNGERQVIKFLVFPRNEFELKRFTLEAQTLLKLNYSPFAELLVKGISELKKVHDFDIYYFSMEYVEGCSLLQLIEEKGLPLAENIATQYLYRIAVALSSAHVWGVVHRDLHLGNILLLKDYSWNLNNDDPGVRIIDYGLAMDWWKDVIENSWSEDNFHQIGALSTWSPESINAPSKVDLAHDVWALGSLYFRLLTNEWAFYTDSFGQYYKLVTSGKFNREALNKINISMLPLKILERIFEVDPERRISMGDLKKMCHDYFSGSFDKISMLGDHIRDFYLSNDGDVWVCPYCKKIIRPFGNRCANCGKPVDDFLPIDIIN